MIETNKSYRIKTVTGSSEAQNIVLDAALLQDVDAIDVLSVSLKSVDAYKKHSADYGVIVGRVIANNGFGVPNAKVSVFIEADVNDNNVIRYIYPFDSTSSKDENGVRYNLLPDNYVSDCHQIVGTFPNKRYMLDNDVLLEVFDKYYKFTAKTNRSGDYLICGVPVGNQTIHMDLDISDCGILSQRPRDFVYKGYNIEQFENANKFKEGTNYNELTQVISQDRVVRVEPFWGNSDNGETIGITRADIDVPFTFETTCVFMGSIGSDNTSQGITEKCIPTAHMGDMDEMVTGEGTIEMIRKTPNGKIEEYQIKGTQLINADGVWCYQIPMNLDYVMTDEYGNIVPTDDPKKGVATRAQVRFRLSMQDSEGVKEDFYRPKILIPNNPEMDENGKIEYDYEFGSATSDDSFRDLFWNNVYSVKSYIPRFQKSKWYKNAWKDEEFSGVKHCNFFGANNPMPYNSIRIKMPFVFLFLCSVITAFLYAVRFINDVIEVVYDILEFLGDWGFDSASNAASRMYYITVSDTFCPDMEGWFFAPGGENGGLMDQTHEKVARENEKNFIDSDGKNITKVCIETDDNYLRTCININLANEYRVLNFDFYNDWINGFIYIPRIKHYYRPKSYFLGIPFVKSKTKGCMDSTGVDDFWGSTRQFVQLCGLKYNLQATGVSSTISSYTDFHSRSGFKKYVIFRNGGICHEKTNSYKQRIFYLRPSEKIDGKKVNLYSNDLILLGSLSECNLYGIPQLYKNLKSTTYILPPNLPMTNLEDNTNLLYGLRSEKCTYHKENGEEIGHYEYDDAEYSGLSAFYKQMEGTQDGNDLIVEGEKVDTVALTEISGIVWNLDGPNQVPANHNRFFYNPGGHFLEIACWQRNMKTKMKTCINLTRICELGSSMSQRRLDARKIDNNNNILYTNIVPTGFISNADIIDPEGRSMFATLNSLRLIATKVNEDNGYKTYDFLYKRPSGFDGVGKSYTTNEGGYNDIIVVEDESSYFVQNFSAADQSGKYNVEVDKTMTKTFESTNVDYLKFRFGLKEISKEELSKHFLKINGTKGEIPMYDNSFYFYFGLNQGSTALDEFNKMFFGNCESRLIKDNEPKITAYPTKVTYQSNNRTKFDITIKTENVPLPWTELTYSIERTSQVFDITNEIDDTNILTMSSMTPENYTFNLLYGDGIPMSFNIDLTNYVTCYSEECDFKVKTDENDYLERDNTGAHDNTEINENGGYIMIDSVKMPYGLYNDSDAGILQLRCNDATVDQICTSATTNLSKEIEINSEASDPEYFFVPYADKEYYIRLICGSFSYDFKPIFVGRATCELYIGTGGSKVRIPQDCKFKWWEDGSESSNNIKIALAPYIFDYRALKYKDENNAINIPITCDGKSTLYVWGFPEKEVPGDVDMKFEISDILTSEDRPDFQNGYSINHNASIAGGYYNPEGYYHRSRHSFGFDTPIKSNFYCITAQKNDTSIFWHDKVDGIKVNDAGCPVPVGNDWDYKQYLKFDYPCVIYKDENNFEIQKFNIHSPVENYERFKGASIYPMFICPVIDRERKLIANIFEYCKKDGSIYKAIYSGGTDGTMLKNYNNMRPFSVVSCGSYVFQNPKSSRADVRFIHGSYDVSNTFSCNLTDKWNGDVTVENKVRFPETETAATVVNSYIVESSNNDSDVNVTDMFHGCDSIRKVDYDDIFKKLRIALHNGGDSNDVEYYKITNGDSCHAINTINPLICDDEELLGERNLDDIIFIDDENSITINGGITIPIYANFYGTYQGSPASFSTASQNRAVGAIYTKFKISGEKNYHNMIYESEKYKVKFDLETKVITFDNVELNAYDFVFVVEPICLDTCWSNGWDLSQRIDIEVYDSYNGINGRNFYCTWTCGESFYHPLPGYILLEEKPYFICAKYIQTRDGYGNIYYDNQSKIDKITCNFGNMTPQVFNNLEVYNSWIAWNFPAKKITYEGGASSEDKYRLATQLTSYFMYLLDSYATGLSDFYRINSGYTDELLTYITDENKLSFDEANNVAVIDGVNNWSDVRKIYVIGKQKATTNAENSLSESEINIYRLYRIL